MGVHLFGKEIQFVALGLLAVARICGTSVLVGVPGSEVSQFVPGNM
jgi:hypothetical protein